MTPRVLVGILTSIAAVAHLSVPSRLLAFAAKPDAPVSIVCDPLPLKQNDEGVLNIRVTAITGVDRLTVSITAARGVALVIPIPTATFSRVSPGERHEFHVAVRLTTPDFGYVSVAATTLTRDGEQTRDQALVIGSMPPATPRTPIGLDEDLANLILLKVSGATAIVRFGSKQFVMVKARDFLGRNKAEIIEIAPGRIVLDETVVNADGTSERFSVTLKEGEKGGTRVPVRP